MRDMTTTDDLAEILSKTDPGAVGVFLDENQARMYTAERPFPAYMRTRIDETGQRRQDIFLAADIPERYGYKLLSGEKHTRRRDVIVRLCLGARFDLHETQTALRLYGFSPLYARVPRDAVLMAAVNARTGSAQDADELLRQNGLEPLCPCGAED